MGIRFYWTNKSSVFEGASLRVSRYRLLHKWTKDVPLKNMTHKDVIEFITKHIIHRLSIPQTLKTDQGTSFLSGQVREFIESYKIRLLNSSPYYAQANGQAKSSNKTLIKLIKKKI
jgi:transposase InsO family protein